MKKLTVFAIVSALLLSACSKTEKPEDTSTKADVPAVENAESNSNTQPNRVEFTEEGLRSIFTDPETVTAEQLEAIVQAIGKCEPKEMQDKSWYNISDCPAYKVFNELASGGSKSRKIDSNVRQDVYRKVLKSADSAVLRSFIYSHLNFVKDGSLFKGDALLEADENAVNSVLDIIKAEKDIPALRSAVSNLTTLDGIYKHQELVDFLLDYAAKHEDPLIRRTFAERMAAFRFKGIEKARQTVLDLCNDSDRKTSDHACGKILEFEVKSADQLAQNYLKDPSKSGAHAEIIKYYNKKWLALETPNAEAYKTVLDYLKTKPRTEEVPAWGAISDFSFSSKWKSKSDAKYSEWAKAATFFNEKELINVLSDIVIDPNASFLSRVNAADVMIMFGAADELKAATKKVEADKENESKNRATLNSLLKK